MSGVGLIDTTLRDGVQSLWATRMTTDVMIPILPVLDRVGFHSIEHMANVQMEACVRYLGENPWDRMRAVREHVKRTPLRMLGINQFFSFSGVLPDDVVELFTQVCARYVDHLWIGPAMNDVRSAEISIRAAKEAGKRVEGGIRFTVSPVHTDEFFVSAARELVALSVDGIVLKDAGGLLTPERVRTLVPKIVEAASGLPVICHSHCVTGLGPASNLEAVQCGASAIWTASRPLANGASLPADDTMAAALTWMGYEVDVDQEAIREIAEYFTGVARAEQKPLGQPAEYDPRHYVRQIPGGMISNFRAQLREISMEDRLEEVIDEVPRVREELGWPNMDTPYSQFVATQALLNVLYGRYEIVPDEVRRLALGYWGRTPGSIDPEVLDRVGHGEEPVTDRPGSLVPPLVERVRKQQGQFGSEEDLLLAILFMPETLEQMRRTASSREHGPRIAGRVSVVDLVREVARSPKVRRFSLVQGSGR